MAPASSRPSSVSTTVSSLMQEVPGAFAVPMPEPAEYADDEQQESKFQSLAHAVFARRKEYVEAKHVRIKVGTWNVAAFKGTEKDIGAWFVEGKGVSDGVATGFEVSGQHLEEGIEREDVASQEARFTPKHETVPKNDVGVVPGEDQVGLYVLGLQEVVDLGSAAEALRPYADPSVSNRWKDALGVALPAGYRLVAEQQLIGLLLLVYAAPEIAEDVKCVSTTSVGTGLMGYMGNKGAVTARIVLGETTRLVFINCHLAAGADKTALERRNWDTHQILSRTRFEPIQDAMELSQNSGEQIGDEDFAFWCGDLNYRLEGIPGDDVRRLLMLHTRNEYDLSQQSGRKIEKELHAADDSTTPQSNQLKGDAPSDQPAHIHPESPLEAQAEQLDAHDDPTSLQTTLSSLLPHDELGQQMRARKAFYDGWQEGPIDFLPSYKYDPGSVAVFDSSEKKRAPSWCDRILYRTRKGKLAFAAQVREEELARRKDEEMRADGTALAATDEDILYDYDPDTDGAEGGGGTMHADYDEYDENDDDDAADADNVAITREGFEDEIALEYYTVHQRVLSSDHKPLVAGFKLKYDSIVPTLKAQVYAEVAREWDKAENEGRPNVTVVVDKHHEAPGSTDDALDDKFEGVWFGSVRWAQRKHRSLTIANTSRVPARFTFIERPVDKTQSAGVAPRWLSLQIDQVAVASDAHASEPVLLEPGESCNVELDLRFVSAADVLKNNASDQSFEDILVLRVENGRDHFIPVRGKWMETTLGRSIDKLIRIPEGGIRRLQQQKPHSEQTRLKEAAISTASSSEQAADAEQQHDADCPVRFSAPRELFRLTAAIEDLNARVIAEWEMTHLAPSEGDASESVAPVAVAPWHEHLSWPFEEKCWFKHGTDEWSSTLAETCNALDEDQAFEPCMPATMPKIERLYILCDLLLTFLTRMSDGVVTHEIWSHVEQYLSNSEKARKRPGADAQRTSIQEILSRFAPHNISFVLVTSMLERMIQEVNGTSTNSNSTPVSPVRKAGVALQRVAALGRSPQGTRRAQIVESLAKTFAPCVIHANPAGSEKACALQTRRKAQVIELFLAKDDIS